MRFILQNNNMSPTMRPLKILSIGFILIFLLLASLSWFSWDSYRLHKGTQHHALELLKLNGSIIHYDEVLTMSAKMAAATGDLYWEERYNTYEPQLEKAIQKLISISPEIFSSEAAFKTNAANINLVAMEKAAFKLVREGKVKQAKILLGNESYKNEKIIYASGMQEIINDLDVLIKSLVIKQSKRNLWSALAAIVGVPLVLFIWFVTYKNIQRYIEQRKQSEEALRKSESNFRELFELSPIGLALCKMDGQLVAVNPAYANIMGYSVDETLKLTYWDITPKKYEADENVQIEKIKKTGGYGPYEKEYIHKDGHLVPVRLNGMVVIREDKEYIWSSVEDITVLKNSENEKIKLVEQLRQSHKMEAIGTLAGGIAHDFNNLLGIILGYAEMVNDDTPENSATKKKMEHIINAGNRAKDLVSQILLFSRKEAMGTSPVQIHLLVKESLELIRSSIPTTIEITQNIDSQSGYVKANTTKIQQVFMNLCTNAAHSMDEKGGVLEVELVSTNLSADDLSSEPDLTPGPYIQLSVKDNGTGIAQHNLSKIFDPYFTTKEFGKGSGMGLAVVEGIVKSFGGMIKVDSKLGYGTSVNVYLPKVEGINNEEIVYKESLPMGNERVLVVDDEEFIVDATKLSLERLGYHVTAVNSSQEAFELFQSQPNAFDIVISDQTMPGMTGDELAKKMLEIRPNIPIIICTGYSSKMDKEKANQIGISALIMKPVDKEMLFKTIRRFLDKNTVTTQFY